MTNMNSVLITEDIYIQQILTLSSNHYS